MKATIVATVLALVTLVTSCALLATNSSHTGRVYLVGVAGGG